MIEYCPSVEENCNKFTENTRKCIDFEDFAELSPGFYLPKNNCNNTADVIGVLNVNKTNNLSTTRLILFIQLKGWFKDVICVYTCG